MIRRDLIKHLTQHGCTIEKRSGRGPHEIWHHDIHGLTASVPRHREIPPGTAKKICEELGIPKIKKK